MKGEKIRKEAVFEMNRQECKEENISREGKINREAGGERLNVTETLPCGKQWKSNFQKHHVDHLDMKFNFDFESSTKSKEHKSVTAGDYVVDNIWS